MAAIRSHEVLAYLLVCLCILQTTADSHGQPSFSTAMCVQSDSLFIICACVSYESSISEAFDEVMKMNFTGKITITDIMAEVQTYEKNITDIVSRGVCMNLTDFQTCLDENMPSSTKTLDNIIKSIVNTSSIEQVLRRTFCTIEQDLKDEIPTCLHDMVLGSAFCVGTHDLTQAFGSIIFTPNSTTELVQTALCPSLGSITKCIGIQTFGCGANINSAISSMTNDVMTASSKQKAGAGNPSDILRSSVMACATPVYSVVAMQTVGDSDTDGEMTPQQIPTFISSIVRGVCSRLSSMMNCAAQYMPMSENLLDKFLHNIIDIDNVKKNEQAFTDGFCTSNAEAGIQSVVGCVMIPNNTAAIEMCMTPDLQTKFDAFNDTTALLAMSGATMRALFCSPLKTFVGCILDVIENKCDDTNVQSLVGTGRDMLLATLRSDCGGIRTTPDVEDGAIGLNVYASVYLLLGLVTVLLNF